MTNRHRTRTKNNVLGVATQYYGDGPGIQSQTSNVRVLYDYEVMDDVVVPDYHKRVAAGEIINNPCAYTVHHTDIGRGTYRMKNSSGVTMYSIPDHPTYHRAAFSWTHPTDTRNTSVDSNTANVDKAKAQAWANIDKTPYAFGEDLLEIKETLRFLRNPAISIVNLTRSFSKKSSKAAKKYKKPKDILSAVEDVWLSYQFAAAPLIRSSMDAVEAITVNGYKTPQRRTARGRDYAEEILNEHLTKVSGGVSTDYIEKVSYNRSDISAGIMYEVSNPLNDLNFTLGLRVKDIPETLWQIVPLSFMVDRVYNISQVLRGFTNLLDPRIKILAGWTVTKTTRGFTLQWLDTVWPPYTFEVDGEVCTDEVFSYTRVPWTPTASDIVSGGFTPQRLIKDASSIADLFALSHKFLTRW